MGVGRIARRVRVSAGGLSLVDVGDPEAPAVLFVHGFPTTSFLWRSFLPLMPPQMRALAPDLLGAGDSDKPADAPVGIEAQAGYLAELLDELDLDRVAVVGHSHGGGVGQLLALAGRAQVLVLIDTIAFDAWPSEPMRELQRLVRREDAIVDALIASAFDIGMGHRDRLPGEALDAYRRQYAGDEGRRAFARMATALDGVGLAGREDQLAELDIPVFLVWGEDDPFVPVEIAERLNELIATSSLALLPGCKHYLPEDAPQTLAPLVYEYLRGTYAGLPHVHAQQAPVIQLGRRPPEG